MPVDPTALHDTPREALKRAAEQAATQTKLVWRLCGPHHSCSRNSERKPYLSSYLNDTSG
jgi:hypothetical protein